MNNNNEFKDIDKMILIPSEHEKENYYNLFKVLLKQKLNKINVRVEMISNTQYELYHFDQPILYFNIELLDDRKLQVSFKCNNGNLVITNADINECVNIITQQYKLRVYCFNKIIKLFDTISENSPEKYQYRHIKKNGKDALLIKNKQTGCMVMFKYSIYHILNDKNECLDTIKMQIVHDMHTEEFDNESEVFEAIDFYIG